MKELDLNLLHVLVALQRSKSVSKAATELGLSQPATSLALGRLRKAFNDPLFVRSRAGMLPTPRCTDLADAAARAIADFARHVMNEPAFDPAASRREFVVTMVDVGELHVLPQLMAHLQEAAPNCNLRSLPVRAEEVADALGEGRCDLAVGLFPNLARSGLHMHALSMQRMACLVRADHPQVRSSRISMRRFLALSHVLVQNAGMSRSHEMFEAKLREQGHVRRAQLVTAHFMAVPAIVAATDMIVTVPQAIATYFAGLEKLRIVEPPINIEPLPLRMFWHPRFHTDAAVGWLRATVLRLFGTGIE